MNKPLKIVGMDPSLRNWGMSKALYDPESQSLEILEFGLIQPEIPTAKSVRQSEKDILSAYHLFTQAYHFAKDADIVCVEVPVGSQSARALVSYATCTSVIGSLIAMGMNVVAVTPTEVKKVIGNPQASKHEVIEWVRKLHPLAPFPTYKKSGQVLISEAKAEHLCDSVVAIYAGMRKKRFLQLVTDSRSDVAA
ncbi:TPA: crossover junction endodeoxyribonuclease RuvC [Acinetobacter baumannii]|nr:crossover junction endodeoxyribonuclease RuvC [Acinetobacter baumannii]EKX9959417.1 crossover junction endodeoxyribonuclease RuvC [Acinetobacter baumannii]EKY0928434.1 crossover junction endodeoxyribonuclease RuvC [Acinetobacter baumannii]EKY1173479.1 crossover junction endodeoxyribonuclease RuvC [Acinetobacter baumannii]HCW3947857.1 crossover junction endodeoxyribonuclease RuvC [Acinetobacter baumannii]